jgi:hypothetical protein
MWVFHLYSTLFTTLIKFFSITFLLDEKLNFLKGVWGGYMAIFMDYMASYNMGNLINIRRIS